MALSYHHHRHKPAVHRGNARAVAAACTAISVICLLFATFRPTSSPPHQLQQLHRAIATDDLMSNVLHQVASEHGVQLDALSLSQLTTTEYNALVRTVYSRGQQQVVIDIQQLIQSVDDLYIVWEVPYTDCNSFTIEIIHYVTGLYRYIPDRLAIVGRGPGTYCPGLSDGVREMLRVLSSRDISSWSQVDIHILHGHPHTFTEEYPYIVSDMYGQQQWRIDAPRYRVGRTMLETAALPTSQRRALMQRVDEVWLPSIGLLDAYLQAGFIPSTLHILPEAVDDELYSQTVSSPDLPTLNQHYNFYSNFKLEERKGWKPLLQAFVEEFAAGDAVSLWIQTHFHHLPPGVTNARNQSAVTEYVHSYVREYAQSINKPMDQLPLQQIHIVTELLSSEAMYRLTKSMHAFVLPTHGEGWCLPCVEAMASGLPAIVTNWSGPLHYLTVDNSLPLTYNNQLIAVTQQSLDFDADSQWVEPSKVQLKQHMRQLYEQQELGVGLGRRARLDTLSQYTINHVTLALLQHLARIKQKLDDSSLTCQITSDPHATMQSAQSSYCCWRRGAWCDAADSSADRRTINRQRAGHMVPTAAGCFDVIPPYTAGVCHCSHNDFVDNSVQPIELQVGCDSSESFTCAQQCAMYLSTINASLATQ